MADKILDQVALISGIPTQEVSEEFAAIFDQIGASPENLTLDELRKAMLCYLHEVFIELQSEKQEDEK